MKIAVTGAYGYSGSVIASRLIDRGQTVMTLTNSPHKAAGTGLDLETHPLAFNDRQALTQSLQGTDVLINTYWVRFDHKDFSHQMAVNNTLILFEAARQAGVRRIVHVSITNPREDLPLPYFQGKARLEQALQETGLSYAILRPAVLFGNDDILINNIAWALRRLPVFGVFGDGKYRLQPIHVEDFAELAVQQALAQENTIINAIGPETFTYHDLVETLASIIGIRRLIVHVPPSLGYAAGWLLGKLTGDVTITRDEIDGLMADLLYVDAPPAGQTRLTDWAAQHADSLGQHYASELARRR